MLDLYERVGDNVKNLKYKKENVLIVKKDYFKGSEWKVISKLSDKSQCKNCGIGYGEQGYKSVSILYLIDSPLEDVHICTECVKLYEEEGYNVEVKKEEKKEKRKLRYKKEDIRQMRSHFVTVKSWLPIRKGKDSKCTECKSPYEAKLEEEITLIICENKVGNEHICKDCTEKYKAIGVEDIYDTIWKEKEEKEELKIKILSNAKLLGVSGHYYKSLEKKIGDMKYNQELLDVLEEQEKEKKYKDYIASIDTKDWYLEPYLEEQYGVIMDKNYLKDVTQIEDYFKDIASDYMDCGQGYCTDTLDKIVKIGEKFYNVHVVGEVGSSKQNYGDRLYWIEGIESVTYKEIAKPVEKKKEQVSYKLELYKEQVKELEGYFKEKGFKYEKVE